MATALSVAGANHTEPGDLTLHLDAEYVQLEQEIDGAESAMDFAWTAFGIAVWKCGGMVSGEARANGGRMPHGRLDVIVALTGKSRSTLQDRRQFFEAYPTEAELTNALGRFRTWKSIVRSLRKSKPVANEAADGQFQFPEVDWQPWETGPLLLAVEAGERDRYWRPVQEAMGVIEAGPLFAYTPSPPDVPDRLRAAADSYEAFNARLAE